MPPDVPTQNPRLSLRDLSEPLVIGERFDPAGSARRGLRLPVQLSQIGGRFGPATSPSGSAASSEPEWP